MKSFVAFVPYLVGLVSLAVVQAADGDSTADNSTTLVAIAPETVASLNVTAALNDAFEGKLLTRENPSER